MSLRTPLGKVRGLGSAKDGTHHWWMQRLTALALIPLSLWFVGAIIGLHDESHDYVIEWLASPIHTALLLSLIFAVFYHAQLGLQVVIEDYVHVEWVKLTTLICVNFAAIFLGIASAVSVLKVAFLG